EGLFHKWLYEKRIYLEFLPSFVYLPVQMQCKMKSPAWDWQSRLCIGLLKPIPIEGQFTLTMCLNYLNRHIQPNDHYPLIQSSIDPIREYLNILEHLKIITQISPNQFKKNKLIALYTNVDSALKGDKILLQNFLASNEIEIEA